MLLTSKCLNHPPKLLLLQENVDNSDSVKIGKSLTNIFREILIKKILRKENLTMFRRFSAKLIKILQVISVERPTTLLTRQTENREVGAVSFPSLTSLFTF